MSLEQQVTALVEASNNLTSAVNNKIGQIDQRVTQAEQEFDQFVATADDRYKTHNANSFRVGGEWGKFYPVRIQLSGGPVNQLNLYRINANANKGNINGLDPSVTPGTFTAHLFGIGDAWGHRTPFYAFDSYHEKEHRFIGRVTNYYRVQAIWVWLRGGGVDYYLAHENLAIDANDIVVHTGEVSDLSKQIGIYLGGCVNGEFGINYLPILEADIDAGLPANGYIRGVV
ncbi:hypothetical protein P0F40_002923 [Vibrio metschnikovii]|nr:hypothetical protein [Vibrio metschnikovii]